MEIKSLDRPFNTVSLPIILAFSTAIALLVIFLSWIGFRFYIDGVYSIRGALLWIQDFPYLGTTHWELRHPYILSVAAAILALGTSELSVLTPNIIAFCAILTITIVNFYRNSHWLHGVLTGIFFIGVPVFAFSASTILPDIVEFVFIVSSLFLFYSAVSKHGTRWNYLFCAGIFAGLAFSTRETSVALVLFYSLLFLVRFGGDRNAYVMVGIGFAIPVIADLLYIFIETGDFLYRIKIDMTQYHPWGEMGNVRFIDPKPSQPLYGNEIYDRVAISAGHNTEHVGPVDVNKYLNPFIALWTNHEYAATFFLMIPATIFLLISPPQQIWLRRVLGLWGLLALCWFITISYVLEMRLHPRYFLPVLYTGVLLNATAVFLLLKRKWFVLTGLIILGVLSSAVIAFDLGCDRLHEERMLMKLAVFYKEPIFTTPAVNTAAQFFIQTEEIYPNEIKDDPPSNGTLYLYSSRSLNELSREQQDLYRPEKSWAKIRVYEPRQTILGAFFEWAGMLDNIPNSIAQKINRPGPTMFLYRVRRE